MECNLVVSWVGLRANKLAKLMDDCLAVKLARMRVLNLVAASAG